MIKTRFAPSPTGLLHVGGARTALFSWLLARHAGGRFVLRIEDTDLERSTAESVQAILDGMAWLGLDYDEGPHYQTRRFARYLEIIERLIEQGDAYYCDCPRERLDALREAQMAARQKPRYDGRCRDRGLAADGATPLVVRFANPLDGRVDFDDSVKGPIAFANAELDDLVIRRSDGSPTYNLSVVVDDMDMEITHVLRGDDHVNNTPRQINILRALGAPIPEYAHVPMILGDDGKRLSKRHGAVGVMEYRDRGYLPEALLNYLVRLGWSHGDQEIFSREQMIESFSLEALNRSPSSFNTEKLDWLNQQYLMRRPLADIVELVLERLRALGVDVDEDADIGAIVDLYRQRCATVNALADSIAYCFRDFEDYDPRAAKKAFGGAALEPLRRAASELDALDEWRAETIHAAIVGITEALGIGMGKVGQPLRVAVTGGSFSPPIDQTLEIIGKDRSLRRIARAIDRIEAHQSADSS